MKPLLWYQFCCNAPTWLMQAKASPQEQISQQPHIYYKTHFKHVTRGFQVLRFTHPALLQTFIYYYKHWFALGPSFLLALVLGGTWKKQVRLSTNVITKNVNWNYIIIKSECNSDYLYKNNFIKSKFSKLSFLQFAIIGAELITEVKTEFFLSQNWVFILFKISDVLGMFWVLRSTRWWS